MSWRTLLVCLVSLALPAQAAVQISPDDTDISYTGRWEWSNTSAPWAFWKGSSIIAHFTGTSIRATFSAGNTDYFRIVIDGDAEHSVKIPASSTVTTHELATGLGTDTHQVEIIKETDVGRWTFYGFELDDNEALASLPESPARRIVFYGDSNLAGYSLESERNESGKDLQGSYYGYAGIVSRMFDAGYHNVSRSGATIRTLSTFFDQMDYWLRNPTWDFIDDTAEVVVLNIGANDVGRPKKRIKAGYHALLDDLRAAHPDAHIVMYNAWGWDYDEPANYTYEVVAEHDDPNISVATFPWVFEQWHGCEYDHAGMAQVLADHLTSVTGWEPGPRDVMSGYGVGGDVANGGFEEVSPFGGYGWRYFGDAGVSRVKDSFNAFDGDYYLNLTDGAEVHQPNPAEPGDTVSVSAWMRGEGVALVTVDFRDQEMWTAPLRTRTEEIVLTGDWTEHTIEDIAPTDTPRPVFHTRVTFAAAPDSSVDIDGVTMTTGDDPPGNCEPTASSVESIALTTVGVGRGQKIGRAVVTVADDCGDAVAGAWVTGSFSGDYKESNTVATGSNGVAEFTTDSDAPRKGKIAFGFCVDDITASPSYDPGANVVRCDSL